MKGFLNGLRAIIAVAAVLAVFGGVLYLAWLWWYGIVVGVQITFGVHPIISIAVMLAALYFVTPAALIFAVVGVWSGIWVLDWPWFWTLALYVTTITVLFVGVIAAMVTAALASLVGIFTGSHGRY